jgi:beta-1,4-N-acetylglucosaminyltransferase
MFDWSQISLIVLVSITVILIIFYRLGRRTNKSQPKPARTLIVLGSGGHTAEMLALVEGLEPSKYSPLVWVVAETDKTSLPRLQRETATACGGLLKSQSQQFETIPRSREVGQSWISTVFSTIKATLTSVHVVLRFCPDVVIVNGPGTSVPIVVGALVLRTLRGTGYPKIIFVESFCRVDSLSLTGKLLYPVCDRFIVQWPSLAKKYKKAEYLGILF